MLTIDRIDHLAPTVKSIELTCNFHTSTLGIKVLTLGNEPKARWPT
jgi:hypothetical protein